MPLARREFLVFFRYSATTATPAEIMDGLLSIQSLYSTGLDVSGLFAREKVRRLLIVVLLLVVRGSAVVNRAINREFE